MNRFKISGRFLPSPQGEDPFARWIKKYGKARHVRDLVCAGGNDALKGKLSGLARAFLDGHLKIFMAQIDALEKEGLPDGVFEAMEAAFYIGQASAATRFSKEVPRVAVGHAQAEHRKKIAPRTAELRDAVREAMSKSAAKATRGIKYAGQLEPEVSKIVGRKVSPDQIRNYVRDIKDSESSE
jgi:hypothetical protein